MHLKLYKAFAVTNTQKIRYKTSNSTITLIFLSDCITMNAKSQIMIDLMILHDQSKEDFDSCIIRIILQLNYIKLTSICCLCSRMFKIYNSLNCQNEAEQSKF